MSTLVTIQSTDLITNSRADLNSNFAALNTDKIETSVLDTDTSLTANSDSKIPTQKAVKAYVDAGGNVNASTTTKGIVEEATQAEINAGTATGATGAKLFVPADKAFSTVLSIVPTPPGTIDGSAPAAPTISVNTTAYVGQVYIPSKITANKISISVASVSVSGTLDLSLYSEDGQTQLFSVTTATISASGVTTTALSAIVLVPGIYYIVVNSNSTTNLVSYTWSTAGAPFNVAGGLSAGVSSEPRLRGELTITAGTPPATITPTTITDTDSRTLVFRLDN